MSTLLSQFDPSSPSPAVPTSPLSTFVSLFRPCQQVHQHHSSRFHIYALIYDTCFSLSDSLHSIWQTLLGSSTSLQITQFHFMSLKNGWVIFYCIYVLQLLYPLICWWTSRLLPCPGYCKQCCHEHWGTCVFSNYTLLCLKKDSQWESTV